ncbi:hypothetical protein FisN_21Hh059 [Fistulifera solaris]|uniref:Regulator of chromosome condensation n=1 Tax=Fistulifera solaris TaxID=1519565 RepID=A0A1Z5KAN5_FISSO|nr:hypothetical protein FisN_21Hh059 [Fistulifera solaris]|eukprot:GAX23256.1 hypothetical protein FisN_21Hh059 [Fistulifera solaris]
MVAMSQNETILISSAGDVLISRCRSSSFRDEPESKCQDDLAMLCCEAQCDDLTTHLGESAMLCSPWNDANTAIPRGGLLGGAPAQVAPYSEPVVSKKKVFPDSAVRKSKHTVSPERIVEKRTLYDSNMNHAFRNLRLDESAFDDEGIIPILSFDYSHFAEGGNDMLPSSPQALASGKDISRHCNESVSATKRITSYNYETTRADDLTQIDTPGVPTFAPAFAQIKITQLSANPLGSHVLLISNAGLLYSYGKNTHGQLGIGLKGRGSTSEHIYGPTIVTPLVENGGKAIACAAGVNHSLVVVATEVRRLIKSQPNKTQTRRREKESTKSEIHHQLYGFGRNDYMKIGLVSPKLSKSGSEDEMENVILPRRVALRCQIAQEHNTSPDNIGPPHGIFSIQASAEHSAALVRRESGDVELYTWGNATHGALGILQASMDQRKHSVESTSPSPVRVVPVPSFVAALSRSSNKHAKTSSMLAAGEYPAQIALGRACSFVTTSNGRCFSFGISEEGMLGLGKDYPEAFQPTEIAFPSNSEREHLIKVSVGAHHVHATTKKGNVYSWGRISSSGMQEDATNLFQWSPCQLSFPKRPDENDMLQKDKASDSIIEAVAGFDCSVFVSETGEVLSCGNASGRLCQGDRSEDLHSPRPVYGGLRLFNTPTSKTSKDAKQLVNKQKPKLRRGLTVQ